MKQWHHATIRVAGLEAGVAGMCPASADDRPRWYVVTKDARLKGIDLDDGSTFFDLQLRLRMDEDPRATLAASRDGRWVAVVQSYGCNGVIIDVKDGLEHWTLRRHDYHADVSGWALSIIHLAGRDVLIAATEWNRLEALELPTLRRLAPASTENSVDYFWGLAEASPSGRFVASSGWHWQPFGSVAIVDVEAWLEEGVDPPPGPRHLMMTDWWDDALCWLDDTRLAVMGSTPKDDDDSFHADREGVLLLNVRTKAVERFIPGPDISELASDGTHLIALGDTLRAIALDGHEEVVSAKRADAWHPSARVALTIGDDGTCLVQWLVGALGSRPELVAHAEPAAEQLEVLSDVLEENGVAPDVLAHCRARTPHGKRCWVIEGLK